MNHDHHRYWPFLLEARKCVFDFLEVKKIVFHHQPGKQGFQTSQSHDEKFSIKLEAETFVEQSGCDKWGYVHRAVETFNNLPSFTLAPTILVSGRLNCGAESRGADKLSRPEDVKLADEGIVPSPSFLFDLTKAARIDDKARCYIWQIHGC